MPPHERPEHRSGGSPAARRLLARLGIELHPGEGRPAAFLFGGFFFCLCFQYAAKAFRQAAFVDSWGAASLPWVYLLVALLSYPILRLYGRLADALPTRAVVALTSLVSCAGLVVFWALWERGGRWVAFVFYLWITLMLALNLSQFWAYASQVFDARQARRLFGFLGAGALLGGIVGGQLARFASLAGDPRTALLAAAAALALAAALLGLAPAAPEAAPGRRSPGASPGGFATVWRSRHLRLVGAVLALSIVVAQIVDLQFNWAVEGATTALADRAAFFGNFYSLMGFVGVTVQLLLTSRIQRGLGVGFSLRVLPVTLGLGTIVLLGAGLLLPAAVVAAGLALKLGENSVRYSLDQATRELLFLPVPESLRIKAKAVIDVFVQRGAKGVAALLLLPVAAGWMTPLHAGWLSLGLVAVWLALLPPLYRQYVQAYRERLDAELPPDAALPIDLGDARTLEVLIQSLGSADSRHVLHSLEILAGRGRGHLVPPLLLYHDDVDVRRATLRVLAEAHRADAVPLIERRLSDDSPEVRAAAIRVLADLRHQDACEMMLPRLAEPDPAVRAAAVACLTTLGEGAERRRAGEALEEMLRDELPTVRTEAARCLGAIDEPLFQEALVQLLYDRDAAVVREAVAAVRRRVGRGRTGTLYLPTLVSLLRDRHLKHDAREALHAFGASAIAPLVHFLNASEEHLWVRRALPKTIASIGGEAAAAALIESLDGKDDVFLRRKIVEALDSMVLALPAGEARSRLTAAVRHEAVGYLQTLADLTSVDGPGEADDLLTRLLRERLDDHLRNVFGLLGVLCEREPIRAAQRAVAGSAGRQRGHALEYLDNTLDAGLRRPVLLVLEDQPAAERLHRARSWFGIERRDLDSVLRSALDAPRGGDADAAFLTVAALYRVYTRRLDKLYPEVDALGAGGTEPFVRETARWISARRAA